MEKKKIYYNIPNTAKIVGKKINKTRQGHSKIFKNLSEFPIQIHMEGKQNQSISAINRPHSSINQIAQQTSYKNPRIQSALSHYPEQNKKRLSLDSTNKKYERDSLMSRNSMSKKASKNQIVIDDTTKIKLVEDRRRYNNSCGSATQDKGRVQNKKKNSQKPKRLSINNLHLAKKQGDKSQNQRIKQQKSLIIRDKTDKSKSKSKNKKKRKETLQLDKSKASTTVIGFINKNDKKILKKKQSLSTAIINLHPKEKKKKNLKKISEKVQIIDQFSQQQYPINKYEEQVASKYVKRPFLRVKSKSKSRKGSTSKQRHKKTYSLIEQIDYASCINIPSNSSGLINSLSHSSHNTSKIKIIDNLQFRYFADQNPTSVNLDEIRYYQSHVHSKKQNEDHFINKKFNSIRYYKKRKEIETEICEDYPNFNELQLKFLASVMFIQRKWRQHRLYKQIFSNFTNSQNIEIVPNIIEKSNSKQLNISSNGPRSAEKAASKNTTQIESAKIATQAQTTPFSSSNQKELLNLRFRYTEQQSLQEQFYNNKQYPLLNNDAYIQPREQRYNKSDVFFYQQSNQSNLQREYTEQERKSSSSKQLYLKSQRYQFLESDIFPNITYLVLKKQQLKDQLHKKLFQINQLHQNDALLYDEYLKLKNQYQREYERRLKQLNKSKQDIKKGYLKFIDTYKDIKHQALRKVSSESGLMANMYKKVFNFDQQHITTPSNSSESLKRLTKRVLIRKQFFLTQKIQPFIYNTSLLNQNNNLSERMGINQHEEPLELSARCFHNRKEKFKQENQVHRKKDMFLDIESLSNQRMDHKRIREGYVISPDFQKEANSKNLTLFFSKSDQLLPLIIKSPKAQEKYQHFPQNYERKERLILEEVIASLTHELYTELVRIDEKRQNMIDFIQEQKIKYTYIKDLQMIEQNRSAQESREEKSDEFEIVQEQKFRQIYKIEGLQEKSNELGQRRHRNSKQYNISPASSQKLVFDTEDILLYTQSFFLFLKKNHLTQEIITKLNKNQGFSPIQYLKFLRDFQIPDDEYNPLISNEIFIEWQDYFYNKYYPTEIEESQQAFIARQSITIFHRCIFESIIFLIEEYRPCGQKGIPFPWQNIMHFPRVIEEKKIEEVFKKCQKKIEEILRINCGIIDQKYIIYNQQDLEKIHEQNEDKIINMLQGELENSPHNWYEVEQHCLEIKLELQSQIMEYLMLEALDEILENY